MSEPFFLLYRTGLAPTNGTSVQVSRLLKSAEEAAVHLMWDIAEAGPESAKQSVVVDDSHQWRWPFYRGRGLHARWRKRFRRWLRLEWWDGPQVNRTRLRRRLRTFPARPKRAWIVCMKEWDAVRAYSIWEALGRPPFVLHIMDILHDGLSEAETPQFTRLVREARHVICISDIAAEEARRQGARSSSVIPCCSDFTTGQRQALAKTLRVAMTGTFWTAKPEDNPALHVLAAAWPEIKARFPDIELHYAGASGKLIPPDLRGSLHDHGFLAPEACQQLLCACHIAYVPVSHPAHSCMRYSLPSRLADYLACGLPTIACTEPGTGIFSFLRSLPDGCAVNVTDANGLVAAVTAFAERPDYWAEVSRKAAEYAGSELRPEVVRARLFQELERC
jgi:glycosyltransferase involved in cell wall biosynthesis